VLYARLHELVGVPSQSGVLRVINERNKASWNTFEHIVEMRRGYGAAGLQI
jgi:hypothetical protein